ncbi:MAG: BspA family leucine-rich repeat surface protein, partial [bacterium]|nr:BspA family leucine-rich repeat surface protein [bacterium]
DESDREDGADDADDAENVEEETEKIENTEDMENAEEAGDAEEADDSVSIMSLLAASDNIDSGTYGNITWVVDADGKLTVEGTGEFAASGGNTAYGRAPWTKTFNTYRAIKSAEIKVTGMKNASYMFYNCSNLTSVSFAGSDLSMLEDISEMFYGCYKLESIDFGEKFGTGNVTDMSHMFYNCQVLQNVDLSCFDTGNVTDMSSMFARCRDLGDLDLSGWDTGKVTDMSYMFCDCGSGKITLGGRFTTKSVTNMSYMFARPRYSDEPFHLLSDAELDLAWLDLSGGADLGGIFSGCNVRGLDLSRLDTSTTTTLAGLFASCDMTGVDFSDLRTDTITDMSYMFSNGNGTVALHTLNTESVTDMSYMFRGGVGGIGGYSFGVNKFTSLDLSGLNTEKVTDMSHMFAYQDELTGLDVSVMDTRNLTDAAGMFYGCTGLTSLDLNSLDLGNVTDMASMFYGCIGLTNLDFSSLDLGNVANMVDMFANCSSLAEVNLGNLGSAKLEMISDAGERYSPLMEMFFECKNLKSLDLSQFNFEHLTNASLCFSGCTSLTTIRTPYNVAFDYPLPDGTWYMADGTTTTILPKNLSYSVLLQKDKKPEATEARLEVSKRKTVYACGETVNTDDLTVRYYGTDGSVTKLTADAYTTSPANIDTSEPGEQVLTVTYQKDGATLTAEVTLTIVLGLTEETTTVTLAETVYTYDGQPKEPVPTVTYTRPTGGSAVTLTAGTDYTVSYRNNINAYELPQEDTGDGTAAAQPAPAVIIKGAGSYSGAVTKTFTIRKAAAPAAEEKNVTASQCTEAKGNRTADLSDSFAAYGRKTGYEITGVEDPKSIFSKTPVTADIRDGVLTYGTKAAQEGDTAAVTVKVSFANYGDAVLTVKIVMAAKKAAEITGITVEDTVYNGTAASYSGTPLVRAEDGTDLTDQVELIYTYSGTQADGTAYPAAGAAADAAPVNAGSYRLTVEVQSEDYIGIGEYPFTIAKAAVTVRAEDLIVLMEEGQAASRPTAELGFSYEVKGLLNGDILKTEPQFKVFDQDGQEVAQIDVAQPGVYRIVPFGADAGMNYEIKADAYVPGTLTVSEERVVYTVRFDLMGHGADFTKGGVKAGSLLELTEAERTPEAAGYLFAGWYKDK